MRKIFFFVLIFSTCFCNAQMPYSKLTKIAVFDLNLMVQALPGYKIVDSLMLIYEQDTLGVEYAILENEYTRIDSLFKYGEHKHFDRKKIDTSLSKKQELGMKLVYWQQYAQQKDSIKRRTLAEPLYQRVRTAFYKVISTKNYDIILKPDAVEFANNIDNLFIEVGNELGLFYLPMELLQIGNTDLKFIPKHTE